MLTPHFFHLQSEEEKQPVSGATSASPGTSADSDTHSTVIAHQLKSAMYSTLRITAAQKTINRKAAINRQNMSTWMGMGITNGNGKRTGIKPG